MQAMQEDCSIMRVIRLQDDMYSDVPGRSVCPSLPEKKNAVQTTTTRPCHLEKVLATDTHCIAVGL